MIRLFDSNEINFNHNKTVLTPITCYIIEEQNGMFELEIELPKNITVSKGQIIKAPTQRGEQLFRVYRSVRTLKGRKHYAKHIYYDLSNNFIISTSQTNVIAQTMLQSILSACETTHTFTIISDILDLNTAKYERINPVAAMLNSENGVISLWGGNLIRNNFNIQLKASGLDRGYEIRLGKNLIGVEDDSDISNVKTRLYPTVDMDGTIIALPEKFVDSPLIGNYEQPFVYEERVELTDEQKELSINEIFTIMRNHCTELYSTYSVDKPVVNYKIDFVELSKTEQYKRLAILEQLDLYDIVTINISDLDINVKAKVIKYTYDCLKNKYDTIELGDFKSTSNYQTDGIVKQITERIRATQTAVDYATNVITGNRGGYVIVRRYPNGEPYEILIMDTQDINTAVNVLRINNSGIGFSRSGYNGPYGTAMTLDGHIVADYMDTGTLTSILLKSDNYIVNQSGMKINLADGTIDSKNFKLASDGSINASNGNFSGSLSGSIINGSEINGSIIKGSSFETTGNFAGEDRTTKILDGHIESDYIILGELGTNTEYTLIDSYQLATKLIYANTIRAQQGNTVDLEGTVTVQGSEVITVANISAQTVGYADRAGIASSATSASSASYADSSGNCYTGYLTLSGGTLVAPSGSLWIGQNTVKANTIEQTSSLKSKKNIVEYTENVLDKICNTITKTYNYNIEDDGTKVHLGIILEESPLEIVNANNDAIDLYAMVTMCWKGIQEQQQLIKSQEVKISDLETRIAKLEEIITRNGIV